MELCQNVNGFSWTLVEGNTGITVKLGKTEYTTVGATVNTVKGTVTTHTFTGIGSVNGTLPVETASTATDIYVYNYLNTYQKSSY